MAATIVRNVFVYGSLMAPEVLNALLQRVPPSACALVHDFHRYSIKGRVYPAAVHLKGSAVTGKVLFDLTDQELNILNEFEDEYVKDIVEPTISDPKKLNEPITEPLKASMFVWANPDDKDLFGDWDYQVWRDEQLEIFLEKYLSFAI